MQAIHKQSRTMSDIDPTHTPLIPMSEILMSGTNESSGPRQPPEQQSSKTTSSSHVLEIIESDLKSLSNIKNSNNEEIKKKLTEIQSLRENNLVVVGAIGGLQKIKEKV